MEELISDLLSRARDPDGEGLQSVSIAWAARQAWEYVRTEAATLSVAADHTVEADPSRLLQLFENLFRNAVEHGTTGTGGTVALRVDADETGFAVADDGPGIPPAERENVFDAGYSTSEDGTWYGLAIVRDIVTDHGWEIQVSAGNDGGTRFEISTDT